MDNPLYAGWLSAVLISMAALLGRNLVMKNATRSFTRTTTFVPTD